MAITRGAEPLRTGLADHREWRPDWRLGRACWQWYLTPTVEQLRPALEHIGHSTPRGEPWLHAVPVDRMHITLCEVGFDDEHSADRIDAVREAGRRVLDDLDRFTLRLGPVVAMRTAVALAAGPVDHIRELQRALRHATERVTGVGRGAARVQEPWPHLSIGYTNRSVDPLELDAMDLPARRPTIAVATDRVSLASVQRLQDGYHWSVHAHLPLGRTGTSQAG